ncbi:glycosyltransferase family 4 protein [Paracoccus sp. MBLB3053]|uniref:Glycosyltransferase family 4 protein n=1 Tax=Paracoccus aurantius TaxID=3073814 RepID=A0ABU2HMS4_9RHOB|nr:glycosyltransferase family 4 protein [Paracoccus sp. MBLB3053]MDS9466346.1 glycosyltransferase family 4 protein [Paracoccus sp. MBLB3053]
MHVHRFAHQGDATVLSDPADLEEHELTERILDIGGRGLLAGLSAHALHNRQGLAGALSLAKKRAAGGESSLPRQIIYLAEGARLASRAKELGLDHIHAHFGTNSARVASYARMLGGPSFSFTVHGPEEFDRPEALDLSGKLALAEFCVTVSSFGRSQMLRWARSDDIGKVKVVHCGLDLNHWKSPPALPDGPLHLVAVGRFAEQKGFGLLIRAFAQAWKADPSLRLSLVGDGELRREIETIISSERMTQAVRLLGWQDEAGVRTAMDAAHALVTPSFAEGLPVVIMEAMARGRPVISTYIAGIPELVRPGREGWLVPAGDSESLAEAMLAAAATSRERMAQMGQSALQRVAQRHDIARSAEILSQLFIRAKG